MWQPQMAQMENDTKRKRVVRLPHFFPEDQFVESYEFREDSLIAAHYVKVLWWVWGNDRGDLGLFEELLKPLHGFI